MKRASARWALCIASMALTVAGGGLVLAQQSGGDQRGPGAGGGGGESSPSVEDLGFDQVRKGDIVQLVSAKEGAIRGVVISVVPRRDDGSGGALTISAQSRTWSVQAGDIEQLSVEKTAYRRYIETRLTIPDEDTDRLLELVEWLQEHELYDEAVAELEGVLDREPANDEAARRLRIVEALRDLERREREGEAEELGGGEAGGEGEEGEEDDGVRRFAGRRLRRPTAEELPLLNEEQINLLKVVEIDLSDPPRVVIDRRTVERLFSLYGDSPLVPTTREGRERFRQLPPEKILEVMFRLQARDLYREVEVVGNPKSMLDFRQDVQTRWLVNGCATTRCHGGVDAGRFQLVNYARGSDRSVYTNFAILDAYESDDGLLKMIDWDDPPRSLLVQMGLPRADALYPHPDVIGYRPVFGDRTSDRYQDTIAWIESMYRPRPEFELDWEAPHERYDRLERERREREAIEEQQRGEGEGSSDAPSDGPPQTPDNADTPDTPR